MQQTGVFSRPPTIHYSLSNDSLFIDHAMAIKLQLLFPSAANSTARAPEVVHPLYVLDEVKKGASQL